jgi:hypothetical protein
MMTYSLETIDQGLHHGSRVDSGEIQAQGSTSFYRFHLNDGQKALHICKRFDDFRVLHEAMDLELQNSTRPTEHGLPAYHILPLLPQIDINSVS